MTTKDEEILRLRLTLQRAYRLLQGAGLPRRGRPCTAAHQRLHNEAAKIRDVVGDVDAPVPSAETEMRDLLCEARTYLERGGRYVRTGSGLLDDLDAVLGPRTPGDGDNDLPF